VYYMGGSMNVNSSDPMRYVDASQQPLDEKTSAEGQGPQGGSTKTLRNTSEIFEKTLENLQNIPSESGQIPPGTNTDHPYPKATLKEESDPNVQKQLKSVEDAELLSVDEPVAIESDLKTPALVGVATGNLSTTISEPSKEGVATDSEDLWADWDDDEEIDAAEMSEPRTEEGVIADSGDIWADWDDEEEIIAAQTSKPQIEKTELERVNAMKNRIDNLENRIDNLENRINNHKNKINQIKNSPVDDEDLKDITLKKIDKKKRLLKLLNTQLEELTSQLPDNAKWVRSLNTEKPTPKQLGKVITPALQQSLIDGAANNHMTKEEMQVVQDFYASNYDELSKLTEPTHIKKELIGDGQFPRSLVYVPDGEHKGLHVLLKTKEGAKEIGVGSFNLVTDVLHVDQGKIKIFRTCLESDVLEGELHTIEKLKDYPHLFAVGVPIKYKGSYRPRGRDKNIDKSKIQKSSNVPKLGMIMEKCEGGELLDKMEKGTLPQKETVGIALQVVRCIKMMHSDKIGVGWYDVKAENVLFTRTGEVRISDFGMSMKEGEKARWKGTRGYLAPEIVQPSGGGIGADIWSVGILMSEMFHGDRLMQDTGQFEDTEAGFLKMTDPVNVDIIKESNLPDLKNPNHLDSIINDCLLVDPDSRPDAEALEKKLSDLYDSL